MSYVVQKIPSNLLTPFPVANHRLFFESLATITVLLIIRRSLFKEACFQGSIYCGWPNLCAEMRVSETTLRRFHENGKLKDKVFNCVAYKIVLDTWYDPSWDSQISTGCPYLLMVLTTYFDNLLNLYNSGEFMGDGLSL